jgi:hypothetical protein
MANRAMFATGRSSGEPASRHLAEARRGSGPRVRAAARHSAVARRGSAPRVRAAARRPVHKLTGVACAVSG